ncbi:Nup53/35/40-type RNA recognition motif-domain-containing protein [Dipodascopsis tothii]|uniref:Nup53/35/40-type RNA recognition motif-domain-containing protein n=1 Tax=Dipodascopsis tothii TaxID=44089 RepID=UPI0034CE6A55
MSVVGQFGGQGTPAQAGGSNGPFGTPFGDQNTGFGGPSPGRNAPPTPSWASGRGGAGEQRRMIPSHLTHMRYKNALYTPERPASLSAQAYRPSSPSTTTASRFGGPSFGTPKPGGRGPAATGAGVHVADDDLPPTESMYDSAAPFAFQVPAAPAERREERWADESPAKGGASVVVFGFPTSVTPVVVRHFARFGSILEHLAAGGDGRGEPVPVETGRNWLKITYTTAAAASRALAENGRIIGGYAVGCVPHNAFTAPTTPGRLRAEAMDLDGSPLSPAMYPPVPPTPPTPRELPPGRVLNRAASVPALGGRRLEMKPSEGIFKERERKGGLSSSQTLRGLASILYGDEPAPKRAADGGAPPAKRARQGWLGWTGRKAQEIIFGWDDL